MRTEKNTLIREIIPHLEKSNCRGEIWYDLPYCSYSDYSGSAVEASNAKYFKEKYDLGHRYGHFGSYWVTITARELFEMDLDTLESFKDDIFGLENYPIVDEALHSEIEMENRNECIEKGLFDLPYTIKDNWEQYYPIEILHAIVEEKGFDTLADYCLENQESILEEFRDDERIEYSGGSNFYLLWNNSPIPNDLFPENNGYSQVTGKAINGKTLKGWIK